MGCAYYNTLNTDKKPGLSLDLWESQWSPRLIVQRLEHPQKQSKQEPGPSLQARGHSRPYQQLITGIWILLVPPRRRENPCQLSLDWKRSLLSIQNTCQALKITSKIMTQVTDGIFPPSLNTKNERDHPAVSPKWAVSVLCRSPVLWENYP